MEEARGPRVIIDASSLIIIAKLGAIDNLCKVYDSLGITDSVYEEVVVEGKKKGQEDALVVELAMEERKIEKVSLDPTERTLAEKLHSDGTGYGRGECESIACAQERKALLLIEERKAKILARSHHIPYTILQIFPLEGYIKRKLSYEECIDLMERISVAMNTDLAILAGLKAAALTIKEERERRRE